MSPPNKPSPPPHSRNGRDLLVERPNEGYRSIDELVVVARLGKTWGVRGAITVRPFNPDTDGSWADEIVWLRGEGFPLTTVEVDRWEDKGGKILANFAGIRSPQEASSLTHLEVLVPRDWLPQVAAEDEHYVHDLIGMAVVDIERGELGTIAEVFATGASDIWVVRGDNGEVMIPAVKDFVLSVDPEARRVEVRYEEF